MQMPRSLGSLLASDFLARILFCATLCLTFAVAMLLFAGCSTSFVPQAIGVTPGPGGPPSEDVIGRVYGGQQPITAAQVYVYAASHAGYGAPSVSLLTANSSGNYPTTMDSHGNYFVTTDSAGSFGLSGSYTCTPGDQVYLYSLGGNAGAGINLNASLMAILGTCPATGSFAGVVPYVYMNEVSTVAAAYAVAGFAADSTDIGSPANSAALNGIANAFAGAANLYNISGNPCCAARATTPAGNGTVPQRKINSLANSVGACVNSNGMSQRGSVCARIFTIVSNLLGEQASDTATFLIYLAQKPASDSLLTGVTLLFDQAVPNPPFTPILTAVPTDFAIAISYTGGGLATPENVVADATGNIWIANSVGNSLTELSPLGAALSPAAGITAGLSSPAGIAIDPNNNVWVANAGSASVAEFAQNGSAVAGSPFTPQYLLNGSMVNALNTPADVEIDGVGNVWLTDDGATGSVVQLGSDGSYKASTSASINNPSGMAIDATGRSWVLNLGNLDLVSIGYNAQQSFTLLDTVTESTSFITPVGIAVDSLSSKWVTEKRGSKVTRVDSNDNVTNFTGGGLNGPAGIAIDGAGNVWMGNAAGGTLSEFAANGAAITPATGYSASLMTPQGVAVDGSGNVWVASAANSTVTEFVGAATPVVTPLSLGLKNGTLGTRP